MPIHEINKRFECVRSNYRVGMRIPVMADRHSI